MKTKLLLCLAIAVPLFCQAQKTSDLTTATITAPSLLDFSLPSDTTYVSRKTTFAAFKSALSLQPLSSNLTALAAEVDNTAFGRSFLSLSDAIAARTLLNLGGAASLDIGTMAGTVAAGNHTHTPQAIGAEPALGNPGTNGFILSSTAAGVRSWVAPGNGSGVGTVTSIAYTQPAAGVTISGGPITISGTWTFALANDLAALENLSGTGYASRTGTDSWLLSTSIPATDLSGTIAAARMPALTGDVTSSAGSMATALASGSVTLAKMADMATASLLGRSTALSGPPEVLSASSARSLLSISNVDNTSDATKNSAAATLANKRVTPRVQAIPDTATITPDCDSYDGGKVIELSQATNIANPAGAPTDFQVYILRVKTTTARAITYGTQYRVSVDLPIVSTTSGGGKTDYFALRWDAADSKWDVLGKNFGF